MNWFSGRRLRQCLYTGLAVLVFIICLSGSIDSALAADDPAAASAKSSQIDTLEIPGSFKDLPAARDAVTSKGSATGIESVASTVPLPALDIDAEKLSRIGGAVYIDSALLDFHATAYCLKGRTASGIHTRPGVIAADPSVLPLGTVVHLRAGRYTGTYTVMDTGGRIKGRRVDVYVPTYREAVEFGRRQVKIKVLGRNPAKGASKSLLAAEL